MIATLTDLAQDLSIHRVRGDVLTIDRTTLKLLGTAATLRVICDLSEAWSFASAVTARTDAILSELALLPVKHGGKAAFVVDSDGEFGALRMLEQYARSEHLPFSIAVFRTLEEARAWLGLQNDG